MFKKCSLQSQLKPDSTIRLNKEPVTFSNVMGYGKIGKKLPNFAILTNFTAIAL